MRKLAIVFLLVMVGCKRQVSVTTAPSSQPSAAANPNAPGGSSHRDALHRFMEAAKNQDVQAMSNAWGTSKGPVRTDRTFVPTVEEMERRIVIMLRCLRHDSYAVRGETPAAGGERVFQVEVKRQNLTAVADFTTTPGPEGRFYLRTLDLENPGIQAICGAR